MPIMKMDFFYITPLNEKMKAMPSISRFKFSNLTEFLYQIWPVLFHFVEQKGQCKHFFLFEMFYSMCFTRTERGFQERKESGF